MTSATDSADVVNTIHPKMRHKVSSIYSRYGKYSDTFKMFTLDNDPKQTAKITEWLRNNSVTILDRPSQIPEPNKMEHLWRDLNTSVHQLSPSNLTEMERICKEEWQSIPTSRCEKLPKKTHGCTSSKGFYSILSKGS